MKRIAIVGLGLIGGSLGLALKRRLPGAHVIGVDFVALHAARAARGAADEFVDAADDAAVLRAAESAELVVLATPVSAVIRVLPALLERAALVTDCGSTKRAILAAAALSPRRGRFVPGHPMAGRAGAGVEHASAEIFERRPWILCPEFSDSDAATRVEQMVRAVGAEPVWMSAEDHDRAVAVTSHVPQLLASALVVVANKQDAERTAGPAFESATRVAGGAESVWRDIFATNSDEIGRALDDLVAMLGSAASGLETGAESALTLLAEARRIRGGQD
jgi:prephenate dehydrogenase